MESKAHLKWTSGVVNKMHLDVTPNWWQWLMIRVIWFFGFSIEVILPSLLQLAQ
jgi:hypothetical protein